MNDIIKYTKYLTRWNERTKEPPDLNLLSNQCFILITVHFISEIISKQVISKYICSEVLNSDTHFGYEPDFSLPELMQSLQNQHVGHEDEGHKAWSQYPDWGEKVEESAAGLEEDSFTVSIGFLCLRNCRRMQLEATVRLMLHSCHILWTVTMSSWVENSPTHMCKVTDTTYISL